MTGRFVRVLAALIFGAAGGTVVMTGTAYAAACPAGTGVTVVVERDGVLSKSCDGNGGGSASSSFGDAGYSLSNYRGFVCRINEYPEPAEACHSYAPADRYWALFWANGKGGGWVYSSSGASSLNVPTGGWVAFRFQYSSSRKNPSPNPYTPPPAPAPKPATKPKSKPTTTAPSKPNASASASAKTAEKKAKASASASASPSASGDSTPSNGDLVNAANESDGSGGMVWVGAALAALLIIGMGAAVWRRRLAGRQP